MHAILPSLTAPMIHLLDRTTSEKILLLTSQVLSSVLVTSTQPQPNTISVLLKTITRLPTSHTAVPLLLEALHHALLPSQADGTIHTLCWSPESDQILFSTGKHLVIRPLQPSSSWLLAALWLKSLGWRWPFCWGWFVALGIEEAFKVSAAALLD